ncbi:hypothetical protein [Streptomyces sp. NPDC003327]
MAEVSSEVPTTESDATAEPEPGSEQPGPEAESTSEAVSGTAPESDVVEVVDVVEVEEVVDTVDIPKQQSTEAAADSSAGEGART